MSPASAVTPAGGTFRQWASMLQGASGYVSRREMPQGSIGGTLLTVGVVERRSEEQSPRLEALPRSLP